MEIQHVCVPTAEYLWQRISGPFALQGPIVMSLLRQCIWWMIVFHAFHLLKIFCEGRQRQARFQKLFKDHQSQSDSERKGVDQLCLHSQLSPTTPELRANGGAALETPTLVSVSMCVVGDSCGDILDDRRLLLDAAYQLSAPGEEVTVFQACTGPVVQTKLTRLEPASLCFGDTINTPSDMSGEVAAVEKGKSILIQLGRWQIFRTSTGGKEPRWLKLNDTDPVPVVLHSSYSGGILNVEGLHLRGATIQAVTKNKCITLQTKYNGVIESSVDGQGYRLCQVEAFTSETGLPSNNLAEVFVLASKKIEVGGFKLSVNSSAIQIQNDSLRTIIQSIFPLTILAVSATTQILSTILMIMENTKVALVTAWLLPCIVVVATQALPLRIETTITRTLKKMVVHIRHTIYFAVQCFSLDEDPRILIMHEEISEIKDRQVLKNGESKSSFQSAHNISKEDSIWEWEVYDEIFDKKTRDYKLVKRERSGVDNNQASQPFIVIYKNIEDLPWASQVEVCIYSPILREVINVIIPEKLGQSARSMKKVLLNRPELFRIQKELRNEHASTTIQKPSNASSSECTSSNKEKLLHLQYLLHFMEKEFNEIEPIYVAMNSDNYNVSWEMLWAFFPPGKRVVYLDSATEEKLCADVVETRYYCKKNIDKELLFNITVTKWDYNCRTWKPYPKVLTISKFEGECAISSLDVHPLERDEDPTAYDFLQRGSEFCEISMKERCCFRNYKGSLIRYKKMDKCLQLIKENADGRVMIDLGNFARMNPDYPTLGSAKPPCDVIRDNNVTTLDITQKTDRMFGPAMVYGFSFRLKKWGSFSVCGFFDIIYNRSALDDLVMDEDTKDVVEKIVRKQLEDGKETNILGRERLDSIAGKGEGTIFLCYGPPGTGKTLTAESLAEWLECPLWCLSVFELGMTPEILEATLLKVFDVAASWGALLLLDEADVFLERRTTSDLTRNAMTGVFLRLLEYYKGVLFLTTNRDFAFDDAISSRIAMKLHYKKHNEDQRKTMWAKMLERAGLQGVSSEDLAEFAMSNFNGREIRNIVKTAHLLSRSEDDEANLEIEHVRKAFKVYKDSCEVWTSNRATTA